MKIISKEDFSAFVNTMITESDMDVEGVKAKGDKFAFGALDSADELRLDYDVTILPPKKYFLPQYETLVKFDLSHPFQAERPEYPNRKVIIGVHPYDIIAIRQMDSYFLDTDVSADYLRRRKSTLIIGSAVKNVSEKAFFSAMGTGVVHAGFDLFVTDIGENMVIEIGTEAGANLLKYANNVRDASPEDMHEVQAIKDVNASGATRDLKVGPKGWHDLLEKNFESSLWKENSDKCLACGTCTLVCPTCFCYDVIDDVNLDMATGVRTQTWDGCLLRDFTKVAPGEVFREDIRDRYRHRINRKGKYLPDKLGFVACVGCGRCSSQCVPDIADPVNVINALADAMAQPVTEKEIAPASAETDHTHFREEEHDSLHMPQPATILRADKVTDKEMFFEIKLDSGQPLGHQPGQFVEVSLFGTGEAPISVSSAPGEETFDMVVRNVGDVTSKLHAMGPGDKVGIRGPFGKGFDTEALKGKNLLFIAGGLGIVPMRSLINHVLNNRDDFGKVQILYGCKEPCELLFSDEIAKWPQKGAEHLLTVDRCPEGECWEGDIGVVGTLIPKVQFDPRDTVAIVVGPPIFYKFVIADLRNTGFPDDKIIVSLERRMKCGVGKCGHCQMNGIYVCKEGPVFNLADLKDVTEAF